MRQLVIRRGQTAPAFGQPLLPQRRLYADSWWAGRPYGRDGAGTDRPAPNTEKGYGRGAGVYLNIEI